MIKVAELIGALTEYLEAKRGLDQCRRVATGDVEYYCYGYRQDYERAEQALDKALNGYIDQRVAEKIEHLNTRPA